MRLANFLSKTRIVDIKSADFAGALKELLELAYAADAKAIKRKKLLSSLVERESGMSTYLGNCVYMPHARVENLKSKCMFFVGRCSGGLQFKGGKQYANARLIFLMLSRENEPSYLNILSSVARVFSDAESVAKVIASENIKDFKDKVFALFSESEDARELTARRNSVFLKNADRIAKGTGCAAVVVLGDTFTNGISLNGYFDGLRTVLISVRGSDREMEHVDEVVNVHSFSRLRMGQLKSALLVALSKGIIKPTDKICCIGGISGSDVIDTVMVFDVEKEFSQLYFDGKDALPNGVAPEVVERVIDVASELSLEGREGKSVGAIFIVGNFDEIKPYLKQMVLNPFLNYKAEDRNVLSPFMDETVKEFAQIDGAFVISGDGILETAGALVHTPDFNLKLPGGLGARHAAGYSISLAADCLAFVISSSTGQLTLFRKGQMIPLLRK